MSQKRPRSSSPSRPGRSFYWSGLIEDRDSSFKAVYSPAAFEVDVHLLPNLKGATHLMKAWRQPSKQRSLVGNKPLYTSGHDDDGERYAGQKLETLLKELNVEGMIVVARWYGGKLLGPVRFTHILDCAKDALRSWEEAEAENRKRLKRVEDETKLKPQLVGLLNQRDQSIAVLRTLLAEKKGVADPQAKSNTAATSVNANPDYEAMELQTLQRLLKARDATIGFILSQMDKAEKEGD